MNPTKIIFESDKFMNKLQAYSQTLNENLKKDLKSQMTTENNSKISSKKATIDAKTLIDFKKNVKSSYTGTTPDAVYKVLIQNMSDEILASDYFNLENDLDYDLVSLSNCIAKISTYIFKILDKKTTIVTVDNKKYQVEFTFGSIGNMANVTDLSIDKTYVLTWKDTNATLETLTNFMSQLITYEKKAPYEIVKNYLLDVIHIGVDNYIDYLSNNDILVKNKNVSAFLKDELAGYEKYLESIGYSLSAIKEFFKKFFPQTDSDLTQIQKNYKTFAKYEAELEKAVSKLKNPDADTVKNLTAYKNFLSAYKTLSGTTLNISPEDYVTYYFKDVHNAEITQSRASIVGTSQVDSIISEGKNSTIYGESGNDALLIEGDYSKVYGGAGKDSIIIAGNNSEVQGDAGDDNIIITGANVKAEGGYGQDTIWVQGSNITVTGDGETFDYLPIGDTFIIDSSVRNILITDFEKSADKLQLNFSDIVVDLVFINSEQSLVILTADKYEKIVTLQSVNESNFNNITYDGITTSIDWLLKNKKFTVKNPYENIIQVKNNKLENTLSGVQIQAESGNNTITNKGSEVTISAGAGNDYVNNYGDNVIINGGKGDDTIYNDDPGDPSAGLNVIINAGSGNDIISNDNSGAIISGGDGNDNITNYGTNVSISGGLGNDVIINPIYATGNGESVIIDAGEGHDTVQNYSSKVTINGGAGNDSIINLGTSVTLDCGAGDDYVEHNFDNIYQRTYNRPQMTLLLNSYSGNNTIKSGAARRTINGGTNNDYICTKGTSAYLTINGGNGDDEISVEEIANGRIDGGAGKDSITVAGTRIMIDSGEGDDSVYLKPDADYNYFDSTIKAGKGNDVIYIEQYNGSSEYSYYKYFQYAEGDGNDTIYGFHFDRVEITDGEYSVNIKGNDVIIKVGTGSITLKDAKNTTYIDGKIFGKKSTITFPVIETAKNITNTKSNIIISGTKYADTISNTANRVTIEGATDNDSITSIGDCVSISGGAGNDTLYSDVAGSIESGSNVTINGGAGDDYISNDSAYSKLEGNDGKDTITNYGWNTTIDGGTGNDIINNFKAFGDEGNNVSIKGGTGNDSITSTATKVSIDGGDGKDTIWAWSSNIFVDGGADNDYIYAGNYETNTTIYGGYGDDTINNFNSKSYISGGVGNDLIYNDNQPNNIFLYTAGDGNDTIFGFASSDTIQINAGKLSNASVNGSNIRLTIGNGSILLKDAKDKNITVKDSAGTHTFKNTYSGSATVPTNNFTSGNDYYSNSTANITLNALGGNDIIYNHANKVLIKGGAGNDDLTSFSDSTNVTLKGEAGNDTIYSWSGKSYIEGDGGADYIYSGGSNHTVIGGKGNDLISLMAAAHYTIVKYASGDGKDIIYGIDSDDTLQIAGAEYTTVKSGSDLIIGVGNDSISVAGGANVALKINGTFKSGNGISVKNSIVTADKTFTGKEINLANYDATKVNASALSQAVSIVGTAANNSLKGGKGADTIIGNAGNDTVSLGGGNDIYIYTSGNDLIQDYKTEDKIKLVSGSISSASVSSSNVILNISNGGKISIKGGKDKAITIIDSKGKETSNIYPLETLPAGISIKSSVLTASSSFTGHKIDLADYSSATKVNASAVSQAVSIVGTAAANSIKGGKGADTISGGSGNDTVSLGGGKDVYIYSGGNDIIQDYTFGQDRIKLSSGTISGASVSGNDVVLKVGSGSITVKNAKGKYITTVDSKGNAAVDIYEESNGVQVKEMDNRYGSGVTLISGGAGNDTIWNAEFFVAINGGAGDDWIDSDADNVTINGDAGSDSILTGNNYVSIYGGDGNDWIGNFEGYNVTINGGKGNDTISNYESSRTVIKYASGDGDDVISNINDNDTLQITGGTYSTLKSGSDVIFKVGNGSITVQNGINSGFNIDFISSSVSNSRTLDLMCDNNFITNELQIDDISEASPNNYSVGQIEYSADNNNILQVDLIVPANDCNKK